MFDGIWQGTRIAVVPAMVARQHASFFYMKKKGFVYFVIEASLHSSLSCWIHLNNHKKCIYISIRFAQYRLGQSLPPMEEKDMSLLHNQTVAADARNLGISSHDIGLIYSQYSGFSIRKRYNTIVVHIVQATIRCDQNWCLGFFRLGFFRPSNDFS